MMLRWVAAGVLEAVKGFRRVKGYANNNPLRNVDPDGRDIGWRRRRKSGSRHRAVGRQSGDSCGNGLGETIIGRFKTEVIQREAP